MKLPDKTNPHCKDYIVLLEGNGTQDKIKLYETRDAFFNALVHFKNVNLAHMFLEVESRDVTMGLYVELIGVDFEKYLREMYKGGRWTENSDAENPGRTIVNIKV